MLLYRSTRGAAEETDAARAILEGLAPDGGLYMPAYIPPLPLARAEEGDYAALAGRLIDPFFSGYPPGEAERIARAGYDSAFGAGPAVPLVPVGDAWVMELFHGPTAAFKDIALAFLPGALVSARDRLQPDLGLLILAATSGDTGSAAMAGFSGLPGVGVAVFYPQEGISGVQRAQMLTLGGRNLEAAGIRGDFDAAQAGVKRLLSGGLNGALETAGIRLSSANSINVGRLLPQIPYYFEAYRSLVRAGALREGERVDFCVPSGNFGDILAGYLAGMAGLPVGRLICATNANSVLADFFATGIYDRRRPLLKTLSPSMDILVSGNLERLLYLASGRDPQRVAGLMEQLAREGFYTVDGELLRSLQAGFTGVSVSDGETLETIGRVWREYGYLLDPHSAAGWKALEAVPKQERSRACVVLATASPFKFPETVLRALGGEAEDSPELVETLARRTGLPAPASLAGIARRKPLRGSVIGRDAMAAFVLERAEALVWSR